ncbi:putative quinol monooxygenase [Ancylobacter sp.]|uniref:putative quinol monooxygenase n=1 Tax=Ancylobacter sp. TaxID=1872567 RepID=UPI003D0CB38B
MTIPIKIVALLSARSGKTEELQALLQGMAAASRAEPGNRRYDLWQDSAEPSRFVLDELYADLPALAAHRATPHFQAYLTLIGALAERTALVLAPVDVDVHVA